MLIDLCMDALLDTIKLVPFLFITYLAMEYLEHRTKETSKQMVKKAGRFGPFIGSVVGMVPQCGFSAAASGFYAGGVISVGTLLAIFLSTSDEMLPIFLSESVAPSVIGKILLLKVVIGAMTGLAIDFAWRTLKKRRSISKEGQTEREQMHHEHTHHAGHSHHDHDEHHGHQHHHHAGEEHEKTIHDLCEKDHCGCEEGGIFHSALIHTAQITIFLFLISFVIGFLVEIIGQEHIADFIVNQPVLGVLLAGLVGMIPNCAASVIITQMYLSGILGLGQMIAGLLAGAGVGLLVLFRTNKGVKENLAIAGTLYGVSVFWGILIEWVGIVL